jgi:hypothetical protein
MLFHPIPHASPVSCLDNGPIRMFHYFPLEKLIHGGGEVNSFLPPPSRRTKLNKKEKFVRLPGVRRLLFGPTAAFSAKPEQHRKEHSRRANSIGNHQTGKLLKLCRRQSRPNRSSRPEDEGNIVVISRWSGIACNTLRHQAGLRLIYGFLSWLLSLLSSPFFSGAGEPWEVVRGKYLSLCLVRH